MNIQDQRIGLRQADGAGHKAQDRVERLQSLTAALCEALTPQQVVDVVIEQGIVALNAIAGSIVLLSADRDCLELARAVGYDVDVVEEMRRFPVQSRLPMADAVRCGEPVFIESPRLLARKYPSLRPRIPRPPGKGAWAALPLVIDGRVIGAMGLSFHDADSLGDQDKAFMLALARHCAQALDRARLFEAERAARTDAERAEQRLEFLAEASHVLSASLDASDTLATVARLLVPRMADWCTVDLVQDDGSIELVALAHVDPERAEWARELRKVYPPDSLAPHGPPQVIRSGRSEFHARITDELLRESARDEGHLALLRAAGLQSAMIVPLVTRGRTLGAISLVLAESRRAYTTTDLAFAEDLARRIALAIDNAHLYEEAREASRSKDRFLAVLSHELRTPLTPVLAVAAALERQAASCSDLRESAEIIRRNIELEARLIDDLLDLTCIEKGPLKLVAAHGDRLEAAGDGKGKGKGATFAAELPLVSPESNLKSSIQDSGLRTQHSLRILLAEDHPDTSRVMTRLLRRAGHEVRSASSVAEACMLAHDVCPDLLISDIGLPDGTGLDLMRELRRQGIRGIALSGLGTDADIARSREAGFAAHLVKPVDFGKLENLIAQVMPAPSA